MKIFVIAIILLISISTIKATIYCALCGKAVTVATCVCGLGDYPVPSRQGWCCNQGNSFLNGHKVITAITLIVILKWWINML